MSIDMLPDDVLVEIFNFYIQFYFRRHRNAWHTLVHVCWRWRSIVFASPRRLNLRLEYCGHLPMLQALDAWPILPVTLSSSFTEPFHVTLDQQRDNMVAALESEYHNRICEIYIDDITNSRWDRFAAAMQKPFPELTHLHVSIFRSVVPVLPDSFLGGSAPRLRELSLRMIPFPSIPKLLLSANGLVTLSLWDIPHSGYMSPDVMATALKAMTKLESLHLQFLSPRSRPDPASQPLPPSTRFVFPALTKLIFEGVHEYLEDLLSRINAPLLYNLRIIFFMDLDFDVPQYHWLVGHAKVFKAFDHAEVLISDNSIKLSFYPKTGVVDHHRLELQINCEELDWQLSSLAQVCSSSFPLFSTLEELELRNHKSLSTSQWKDDIENAQWLELLDPFTALKNLYLTPGAEQHVCGALKELSGERATEVLPALRNLFVDGFESVKRVQEAIRPFIAARQLSGHPVTIDHWQSVRKRKR